MSSLIATVVSVESHESLHRVQCECSGTTFSFMTLELPHNMAPGKRVKLIIKPSQVGIGKNICGELSFSNLLDATILSIEHGKMLCRLMLKVNEGCVLESIITQKSVERMQLKEGIEVVAIIKGSEVGIIEVMDD